MEDLRARRLFGGSVMAPGDLSASPYRVDRDRIVASPFFARLAGVTQVISPGGSGLLVHNRLTHSLKVASIARGIAEKIGGDPVLDKLGGCDADVVEAAALAHDLGHPPFGHLGEHVLDRLARERLGLPDGFEGNAQSYRIVTSTQVRGAAIGLDLTAAVRAALLKYPWTRRTYPDPHPMHMSPTPRGAGGDPAVGSSKFGAYVTELADVRQARAPFEGRLADWQQTAEASVMDTADDIAYAIHDLEDFHRVGVLQQGAVAAELVAWLRDAAELRGLGDVQLRASGRRPGRSVELLRRRLRAKDGWISDDDAFAAAVAHVRTELADGLLAAPFDGSIDAEQAVARFSARWTRRLIDAVHVRPDPPVRSGHVLLAPAQWHEVQILKFIHHRFVLERPDLALHQRGQARLLSSLVEALHAWLTDPGEEARLPRRLHDLVELAEAETAELEPSDYGRERIDVVAMARGRAIVDFVAALTDGQAVGLLEALSGRSRQLWTDAFVL
ncbi:deoxyguanosinetriphosphate triphosphohydrolase family protein [Dactylosporangium sp. CA-139114]|uniref:deoxyguanosinetriphosphate triphosphohydrolase family protein n=1 Tax=Dactylosporangium sp. CA-139114 TaxID=3239931 RepID=UPI003D980E04